MSELNQEKVDLIASEIRSEWESKLAEVGKTEAMFLATDKTGYVANFLFKYKTLKLIVESNGFEMPKVFKGNIDINIS